jgi:integrase
LHGVLTVDAARGSAIHALSEIRSGGDPAERRNIDRQALTVEELAARFDRDHIQVHLKESTAKEYRRNLRHFILPALGRLPVKDVTRANVARLHGDHSLRPYQANRNLEIVSKMFNLAEVWGLRPDGSNPRRHIKKYPEKKRERFLSSAELRRVGEVLDQMEAEQVEMPSAVAAVRLLMLTGCRLSEIMKLRWEWVDLTSGFINLPDSKTGKKSIPLGDAAVRQVNSVPRISARTSDNVIYAILSA